MWWFLLALLGAGGAALFWDDLRDFAAGRLRKTGLGNSPLMTFLVRVDNLIVGLRVRIFGVQGRTCRTVYEETVGWSEVPASLHEPLMSHQNLEMEI